LDYQNSGDETILSLEPNSETYLQISDANESVLYEGTVTEGEEVDDLDISDEERIYINVGNAPALTIKINGDELEYPVDKDEQVKDLNKIKEKHIYINIRNETKLTIKINGDELEYPVDKDEQVHQKIWVKLKKEE